ncbi:NAD(P)-binding protein [Aureobasidium pullulans EXF-150]|uniref:NAD(P)-binding protein n=1 Tax=Aureobasidium pullulans EXF-150 TaxID=1043002 RepID=A0A074XEV4_AURPU|nr:NAD(P)-binding protein [Aureobasidium pullulans EXF-150]KEQ80572.1 NAD(P)-binding protein [Aureobasidium pullulans EXF-150]
MSADKKINVGVIGYGLSAKVFHIPFIQALPDFNLYAIVQRSPKSGDDASADHPSIKLFRSADDLFADETVDLVIVTSIPETHYEFTQKALESGKHVVVEKPFVPTSKEARELVKLAKEKKRLLAVYQNRRWDQDFVTLKQILASGKLGDIAEFETHFDRFRPDPPTRTTWKTLASPASGALYDLGSHLLDQVYHLFGAPKTVTGFVQVQRKGLKTGDCAPDACTVLLRYGSPEDEMLVTVKSSAISPEQEQLRFWVRGTKGSFRKCHLDVQEPQLLGGVKLDSPEFGVEPSSSHGTLTVASADGKFNRETVASIEPPPTYVEYYRTLAKALKGEGDVPVSGDDAADVLKIIELAQTSSDTGNSQAW